MCAKRHIGVSHSDPLESIVARLLACPIENGEIHKAVDDRPVMCCFVTGSPGIPRSYEVCAHNEARGKGCSRKKIAGTRAIVSGQLIERAAEDMVNKSDVVIKAGIVGKRFIEKCLRGLGGFEVLFIFGVLVKNTVKRAPKSVCPAVFVIYHLIDVNAVGVNTVGKLVS